jgi:hypothetical protein
MWKIDLNDISDLNYAIERRHEKKVLLDQRRPLPAGAGHRIKEDL